MSLFVSRNSFFFFLIAASETSLLSDSKCTECVTDCIISYYSCSLRRLSEELSSPNPKHKMCTGRKHNGD